MIAWSCFGIKQLAQCACFTQASHKGGVHTEEHNLKFRDTHDDSESESERDCYVYKGKIYHHCRWDQFTFYTV